MPQKSNFEFLVLNRITLGRLPKPKQEYRFDLIRRWKFDYAWPDKKIALECEGGCWIQGRHNRGKGFINDCEKYNAATLQGWRVLRYTPQQIDKIIPDLKMMLK